MSEYRQTITHVYAIGLLREDLYNESDADVCEAVRRLPEKEQQLRLFRLKRAIDLSLKHSLLPKEQWTTAEQVSFCFISIFSTLSNLLSW